MNNDNMHVYCPKCGSEVMLADEKGCVIEPKAGDFFLRLKNNDPEKAQKVKDIIKALFGDDIDVTGIKKEFAKDSEEETFIPNPLRRLVKEEDEIEQSIMEDGDINSKFLWRRWIMSQVLRHYKTADGKENFHNYFVKEKSPYYVFDTCINEARALCNMSGIERAERELFFNMDVFRRVINEYFKLFNDEVETGLAKLDRINREIVYRKGFNAPLEKLVVVGKQQFTKGEIDRMKEQACDITHRAEKCADYREMANLLKTVRAYPQFKDSRKPKAWIDAFKGAGAFYTLDNLFRWHGCFIRCEENDNIYTGDKALKYLRDKTKSMLHSEYYKLYAIMKRVVDENGFDFGERMKELRTGNIA